MYQIAFYNLSTHDNEVTRTLLNRYAAYTDKKIQVTSFSSGYDLISTDSVYHIVIVDLTVDRENALIIAKSFLTHNTYSRLILLSNTIDHYQDGFKIGAERYFVKPLVADRFFNDIDEVFSDVMKHLSSIRIDESVDELVSIDSIIYAESENRKVKFYTEKGVIINRETFAYWHKFFANTSIVLCSRGCLVNLKHIRKVEDTTILLHNGKSIPVSRRLRSSVLRKHEANLKQR